MSALTIAGLGDRGPFFLDLSLPRPVNMTTIIDLRHPWPSMAGNYHCQPVRLMKITGYPRTLQLL